MTGLNAKSLCRIAALQQCAADGLHLAEAAARIDVDLAASRRLAKLAGIQFAASVTTTDYLRELAAKGMTLRQAASQSGLAYGTICRWASDNGVHFVRQMSPPFKPERTPQMAALYRDGKTLQQIGDAYGMTRERVRQILEKAGMTRLEGGRSVSAVRNKSDRQSRRSNKYLGKYGCTFEQYCELRDIGRLMMARGATRCQTPTYAFVSQRSNAGKRKIAWEMNLWQWWAIWQESGKWELRGTGDGYVMCRRGDQGPYAPANVFIASARHNNSEGSKKYKDLPIGVSRRVRGNYEAYIAKISFGGQKKHLGSFKTPGQAHARYLMALQAHEAAA